ncbi:MAG: hypothetical protein QM778_14875 [Myxococcales bacterium]
MNHSTRYARCCLLGLLFLSACSRTSAEPRRTESASKSPKTLAKTARDRDPSQAKRRTGRSPVGTNLDALVDYSQDWISVDAFKRSRDWISSTEDKFDDGRKVALDERGWVKALLPGQIATTLMFWDGVKYPSGDYVVLYEGKGAVDYWPQDKVISSGPGRDVLRVDSSQVGIGVRIKKTDPGDPIRNIRVLMPGGVCESDPRRYCDKKLPCESAGRCVPFEENYATQIFHPRFLERTSHYATLRFMDWMQTNGSTMQRWDTRPRPDDARWNKGAPVEIMVELANRQDQDPWFTLPHGADDEYVTKFAEYVRDHLSASHRVYVEHSNEVWNGMFAQAEYAMKRGQEAGLGPSPFEAQLLYHARRTAQIAKIWERVYGDKRHKVVRVLGAQAANAWGSEIMLAFEDVKAHVDALAIAPYFGGYLGSPENLQRVQSMNLDEFFVELKEKALPEARDWIRDQAKVAKQNNLHLVAYEGGQHLTAGGPGLDSKALNDLFDRANRDPRIGQLYFDYLVSWRKLGGKMFVHFTDCTGMSKWGRWGALEWLEQPRAQAPKYDAIARFAEQNTRWW